MASPLPGLLPKADRALPERQQCRRGNQITTAHFLAALVYASLAIARSGRKLCSAEAGVSAQYVKNVFYLFIFKRRLIRLSPSWKLTARSKTYYH